MFRRRLTNPLLWSVCACLAVALASVLMSPPCKDCRTSVPQIAAEEQSKIGVAPNSDGKNSLLVEHRGSDPQAEKGSDKASEYWTVLGRRLKITDCFLVAFTFTLWIATRDLVLSAEQTAEKQLRAYMGIVGGQVTYVNIIEGGRGLAVVSQFEIQST